MRIWFVLFLVFLASPLLAGPWPREKGTYFNAVSYDTQGNSGVYQEFGMGSDWTTGVDAYLTSAYRGHAAVFASKSFALPEGNRMALDIGMQMRSNGIVFLDPWGTQYGLEIYGPELRLGASWGRGLPLMKGGWLTAQGSRTFGAPHPRAKLDLTFGVSPTEKSKVYYQLQGIAQDGMSLWRHEMVAGHRLTEGKDLLIGAGQNSMGKNGRLSLILWQTF